MMSRKLFAGLLLGFFAAWAPAATIVVNSVDDENAATPPNGNCALREAVLSANDNVAVDGCVAGEPLPNVDVIEVPAGLFVLSLAETGDAAGGSLDLTEDVILNGFDAHETVIDGDGGQVLQAVMEVPAGVSAELWDLWVRGGHTSFNGIENNGDMTLNHCRIVQNHGRGLGNWGVMTISETLISENYSFTSGAGVFNQGHLTVVDSTVTDNDGLGISNVSFLHVARSTVSHNRIGIGGSGGIEILNSTITGNVSNSTGVSAGVSITLDGFLVVNNSTITGNTADYGSGLFVQPNAVAQLQNTIVAGNLGSADCYVSGTMISTGGNIEGPGNSCGFADPTDQVNVPVTALALEPLGYYGGPTQTHALLPGSVAIDSGVSSGPVMGCPGDDQRGLLRTDGLCDIGAVEYQVGEETVRIFADGFESGDTTAWTTHAH